MIYFGYDHHNLFAVILILYKTCLQLLIHFRPFMPLHKNQRTDFQISGLVSMSWHHLAEMNYSDEINYSKSNFLEFFI